MFIVEQVCRYARLASDAALQYPYLQGVALKGVLCLAVTLCCNDDIGQLSNGARASKKTKMHRCPILQWLTIWSGQVADNVQAAMGLLHNLSPQAGH